MIRDDAADTKSATRIVLMAARLAVGVALLAYLSYSRVIDWRALPRLLVAWPISLAAIAILFADVMLMALRLLWLFRPQGMNLPFGRSLQLTMVGFFFATFLPGAAGGDLAKLFYAARAHAGRRTEIATVMILDRVIGLFSLLLLPLLFAPLFPDVIRAVPVIRILLLITAFLAFCLLVAFLFCLLYHPMVERMARWAFGFLPWKHLPGQILGTIGAYRRNPGTLAAALGVSLLANGSLIAVTALAVMALNPGSLSAKLCLVVPMGYVVNGLPLTPGGLGVGETAFNALFNVTGLLGGAEALLCWRIWTALVRLPGLIVYLRGIERRVFDV